MKSLKNILLDIKKLESAASVLHWDQETYMPEGGGTYRAEVLAYLSLMQHQMATGQKLKDELSRHIDYNNGEIVNITLSDEEKRLVKLVWKDLKKQVALPDEFVEEMSMHASATQQAWIKARKEKDFSAYAPYLEKMIKLKKQEAEYLGYKEKPYDALLDEFEPGMTTDSVSVLFSGLKERLVKLVKKINAAKQIDDSILQQSFNTDEQWRFGMKIAEAIGLNMKHARQDISAHPFTIGFHPDDVRITTRLNDKMLLSGLFSTIHEGGHAIYEQGLDKDHFGDPLGQAASFGIHESQSRLWENPIGRSKEFWNYALPILKTHYPQLNDVELDDWYRMINVVKPLMIRVESDEVYYSLHIMLRFDIESMIINGDVKVNDIPALWNEKMKEYFGITPKDDSEGVMQDVHWAFGGFGYFPSYAMGNLYGAQIMEQAEKEIPDLWEKVSKGEFAPLKVWLNENVHKHGRFYDPEDLIKVISGEALSADPFMNYLEKKYKEIYRL
ncbi:MAG: carboxypeptidase M32 [Candidatus Marinimicrobia bacterium]|nr:carboxypeptidase M32 [Candidatus Neomarinimicrobiota bacterium]